MVKRKIKVLDSFAGAGGFSLGFELTGSYEIWRIGNRATAQYFCVAKVVI